MCVKGIVCEFWLGEIIALNLLNMLPVRETKNTSIDIQTSKASKYCYTSKYCYANVPDW